MRRWLEHEDLTQEAKDRYRAIPFLDPEDRIEAWGSFVDLHPEFARGRLDFAVDLLSLGQLEAAQEVYEDVQRDWPDRPDGEAGLATVYSARGEHERAMALATSALERGYDWSECYAVQAEVWRHRGDTAKAAECFLRAYERAPHGWRYLDQYCRLTGRPYHSPMEPAPLPFGRERLENLLDTIEAYGQEVGGCDHTLRLSKRYAEEHGLDTIEFYQFLNSHGAFCDCEVCYNVEDSVMHMLGEE